MNSLKALAYRGVAVELFGYGAGQILRLASNLILTRLLFPEAFGLAALVTVFVQGLAMLSDAGFEQSVVHSHRGDDRSFLNTAWTMGIVRGLVLWVIACIGAIPFAAFYDEPLLAHLIPAAGFAMVINGLVSTQIYTARRHLNLVPLIKLDLAAQLVGSIFAVSLALLFESVWALVLSGVLGSLVRAIGSFYLTKAPPNRLEMNREAAREIYNFGKWIFGSSALSFLARNVDRLVFGAVAGPIVVGIYSIAFFLADAIGAAVARATSGVLYPVLSRISRESPLRLADAFYAARLRTDLLGLVPAGILTVSAPAVVGFLYDDRYYDAGWMLQILCVKIALSIIVETIQNCLFSMGQTKHGFRQNMLRLGVLLVAMPVGWELLGLRGLVWAVALAEVPPVAYVWTVFYRQRMLRFTREAVSIGLYGLGVGVGLTVWHLLGITS